MTWAIQSYLQNRRDLYQNKAFKLDILIFLATFIKYFKLKLEKFKYEISKLDLKMFNFLRKNNPVKKTKNNFDVELTASILAYEIARSDADISESELSLLYDEIKKISAKVGKKRIKF